MIKPLKTIISEQEFLVLFQKQTSEILKICFYLKEKGAKGYLYTKRFYGNLTTQSRILEDFLDDYGAKNNMTWTYFRELVASARYMGFSAYMLKHIQNRYALYELRDKDKENFFEQTKIAQDFLNSAIKKVFKCIREEALQLGLKFPEEKLKEEDFLDIASDKMLPHNLDEGFSSKEEENVVKIASDYLNIMKGYEDFRFDRKQSVEEIEALIPDYISEENLRRFELSIQNLQSVYDTYIKGTKIETENASLNSMRGCISVALHLAEIARVLSHFYERHESEIRHETVRENIKGIIDKNKILDCIVNYCLFHCYRYLERGEDLTKDFLKRYVVVDSIDVNIPTYMGFHVRPASLVMKIVKHYGSEVKMQLDNEVYDASSALDIFRANEKISAKKRQLILKEIKPYKQKGKINREEVRSIVLGELDRLAKDGKVYTYENLTPDDLTCETEEGPVKPEEIKPIVAEEIKRLVAAGKIDIRFDIKATFIGDQRILNDIRALARVNYGEDEKGNNIELPSEIAYLRK
jgi:hypothetical protein